MKAFYLFLDGGRIDVNDAISRLGERFPVKILGNHFQIRRDFLSRIDPDEYTDEEDDDRFDRPRLLREVEIDEKENGPGFDLEFTDAASTVISGTIQSVGIKIRCLVNVSESTAQSIVAYLESFQKGTVRVV